MEYRKNAGYTIQEEISLLGTTYVLGCSPTSPAKFVTWEQVETGTTYYYQGHYFNDEYAARQDLLQRAISGMRQEHADQLALAVLSEEGLSDLLRQDREANAWEDIENCFYPAAESLGMSDRAARTLLSDPQFKSFALNVFWKQDHSYENEALQESLEILIRDKFPESLTPSHEDVFEDIAGQLYNILSTGEAATFIDVCAEQILPNKDYMLVVWGEENDENDKFYSVSVYSRDKDGHQNEQILSEFSDSKSFEDLKVTVLNVLDRFEEKVREKAPSHNTSLNDLIKSAESRQGREVISDKVPEHEPSL